MKLSRPTLALALGASLVFVGSAGAAVKKPAPVCNLVIDDKGDAKGLLSVSNNPTWDIVSADVATDKTMLTTVVRVDKLSKTTADDPAGSMWRYDFTVDGIRLYTQAAAAFSGDVFTAGYTDTTSHSFASSGATGVFDTAKNEVRVSVPLATFAAKAVIKAGTKLSVHKASAGDYIAVPGALSFSPTADSAEGAKDYVGGAASCVAVGK